MSNEWGVNFAVTTFDPATLEMIHGDAARSLPPGSRYEIRVRAREPSEKVRHIAWYATSAMADDAGWGGAHGIQSGGYGYYLIGQYVTEAS